MHHDVLIAHTEFDDRYHIRQHFIKIIRIFFDHHLTGIDFGEIQDLVDDGEQIFGRVFDHRNVFMLLAPHIPLLKEFCHTVDRIHRGTDLVAHVGQEIRLCLERFPRHLVLFLHLLLVVFHAVTDEDESHTGKRVHRDIGNILAQIEEIDDDLLLKEPHQHQDDQRHTEILDQDALHQKQCDGRSGCQEHKHQHPLRTGCIAHIVQRGDACHRQTADHDSFVLEPHREQKDQKHRDQTEGHNECPLDAKRRYGVENLQDNRTEKLQYKDRNICFKRQHILRSLPCKFP